MFRRIPFFPRAQARVVLSKTGTVTHDTSGTLTADSASVSGTAVHYLLHATSGALEAQSSTIAGTAAHEHATTGALSADSASVSGTAEHSAAGTFDSTGALSADVATVSGTAVHYTLHPTTGTLSADSASVSGTAVHYTLHTSTGALSAGEATVAGDSVHSGLVTHTTTGALSADSASISGSAQLNGVFVDVVQTSGAPGPRRQQRWIAYINGRRIIGSREDIERAVAEFAEEQAEKAQKPSAKPKKPRIVVEAGKAVTTKSGAEKVQATSTPEAMVVQQQVRNLYAEAYARALAEYELDEEESIIAFL